MRAHPLGFALVCLGAIAPLACCSTNRGSSTKPTKSSAFTLIAVAGVRGQLEPCGCTTDPLGDLARLVQLTSEARLQGPTVVVDAGSLLYSQTTIPTQLSAQEELKADLLARVYKEELAVDAVGLGAYDLANGQAAVRIPRQAANVAADLMSVDAPKLVSVGTESIGIFGVTDPAVVQGHGLQASDPIAAARTAVAQLRQRGAARVLGLATMSRKDAATLAREVAGIDILVVGLEAQAPEPNRVPPQAEAIGDTWLVFPANRGQVVSRFSITLRPGRGPLLDAIGPAAAAARQLELTERIALMDDELRRFESDATADPDFVARHRAERDKFDAARRALAAEPTRVPVAGSYFELTQVRVVKGLACNPEVIAAKREYSQAAGVANLAAAKLVHPVPPPPGTATYVGMNACGDCHDEAALFWQKTRHAGAWATLEKVNKQFDYDCIGCHLTGWDRPGGATMARTELLTNVQCETCHGPGSLHVDAEDDARKRATIQRDPPENLCASQCHTPEHSDTFNATAYLRDIVGPGHGEPRRKSLGDGPTGRELRAAGLAKAGKVIGAGCDK